LNRLILFNFNFASLLSTRKISLHIRGFGFLSCSTLYWKKYSTLTSKD